MLIFFDFLFYSIFRMYKDSEDGGSEFAASCAIAGLQTFNICTVGMLIGIVMEKEEAYFSKIFAGITIGVLFVFNYIRYIRIDKFSIKAIKAKWQTKTLKQQADLKSFQIMYVVISTLFFFGLAFYFGSKKMLFCL